MGGLKRQVVHLRSAPMIDRFVIITFFGSFHVSLNEEKRRGVLAREHLAYYAMMTNTASFNLTRLQYDIGRRQGNTVEQDPEQL